MQQASSSLITSSPSSPSFNSYSSGKLAEIATRVVQEFSNESQNDDESNIFSWESDHSFSSPPANNENDDRHDENGDVQEGEEDDDDDEEFEFAILCRQPDDSPISADEIFYNGQIRPIYPLFNTALLLDPENCSSATSLSNSNQTTKSKPTRLPLRKLFSEERETSSCSSSEADDLENVPAGTYCVWTPKKGKEETPGRCKKSSSTGSSKRWKFRDLLYRSNSDGKDTFVFLTPAAAVKKSSTEKITREEGKENKEKRGIEEHYVKSRAVKEGDKRRSFLPYRQDVVGFFSNVNGLSNLHPF